MKKPLLLIALGACVVLLTACDKTPNPLPAPILNAPGPTGSSPPLGPPAASVVAIGRVGFSARQHSQPEYGIHRNRRHARTQAGGHRDA